VSEFGAARRARWVVGRKERGLSPDDPFEGDPIAELGEELLDAANYSGVAAADGWLDPHEHDHILATLEDVWLRIRAR